MVACWSFSDVDECQNEEHNCDVNARCNNTFGSFNCTCLQGYVGNGVNCSGKAALNTCGFFLSCLTLIML